MLAVLTCKRRVLGNVSFVWVFVLTCNSRRDGTGHCLPSSPDLLLFLHMRWSRSWQGADLISSAICHQKMHEKLLSVGLVSFSCFSFFPLDLVFFPSMNPLGEKQIASDVLFHGAHQRHKSHRNGIWLGPLHILASSIHQLTCFICPRPWRSWKCLH